MAAMAAEKWKKLVYCAMTNGGGTRRKTQKESNTTRRAIATYKAMDDVPTKSSTIEATIITALTAKNIRGLTTRIINEPVRHPAVRNIK